MVTTSHVPEDWGLVGRGVDPETGLPMVLVAREKWDGQAKRTTVWKLLKRPNGWYNVGQFISLNRFRTYPEKNGVKLSDSIIDRTLQSFAEKGYAHV